MATTVTANVVKQGVRASNTESGGRSCNVSYLVDKLVGGTDEEGFVFDAMDASGIPRLGNAYPNADGNYNFLFVKSITSEALGNGTQFLVVVTYGLPSPTDIPPIDPDTDEDPESKATLSVDTTVIEVETEFDMKGNQIITTHGTAGDDGPPVTGSIRYFAPSTTMTFTRNETRNPRANALLFVGSTNLTIVFTTDNPGTWLCTGINGQTSDGGISYLVTYSFQRTGKIGLNHLKQGTLDDAQPWDPLVVQIDPKTGKPVFDPKDGKGMKIVERYRKLEFRRLKLNLD